MPLNAEEMIALCPVYSQAIAIVYLFSFSEIATRGNGGGI